MPATIKVYGCLVTVNNGVWSPAIGEDTTDPDDPPRFITPEWVAETLNELGERGIRILTKRLNHFWIYPDTQFALCVVDLYKGEFISSEEEELDPNLIY